MKNLDKKALLYAYLEAVLFTEADNGENDGAIANNHGYSDFSTEATEQVQADIDIFIEKASELLPENQESQTGHDLWLNRNRHGSGFWDDPGTYGDYETAEKLSEIAISMGERWAYVGDDNKIYFTK